MTDFKALRNALENVVIELKRLEVPTTTVVTGCASGPVMFGHGLGMIDPTPPKLPRMEEADEPDDPEDMVHDFTTKHNVIHNLLYFAGHLDMCAGDEDCQTDLEFESLLTADLSGLLRAAANMLTEGSNE